MNDFTIKSIRAAAVLTTSYVVGTVLTETRRYNQGIVLVQFTLGSLTSMEVRVEFSNDNTTWYQESFASLSSGTDTVSLGIHTMTASGNYRIPIQITDNFIRVSVKGTGTVTSSSCTVDMILGHN